MNSESCEPCHKVAYCSAAGLVILMRRKESLNTFVLIFEIASIVLFAVGKFLK
ncbi:MAG: hypothetical protein II584_01145 [Treponema sp.]|nr:hypothetical protein [Treponema sp.]MBQ2600984.1 hypothetical protein [Treponema sp.]